MSDFLRNVGRSSVGQSVSMRLLLPPRARRCRMAAYRHVQDLARFKELQLHSREHVGRAAAEDVAEQTATERGSVPHRERGVRIPPEAARQGAARAARQGAARASRPDRCSQPRSVSSLTENTAWFDFSTSIIH